MINDNTFIMRTYQNYVACIFGMLVISILNPSSRKKRFVNLLQGAKKVSFTACHSGKLQLACTIAHKSFQLAPKPFLIGRIDNNPSVIWISPKNSTCPSGKLRTKIAGPIEKSTSPGLSDTISLHAALVKCWKLFLDCDLAELEVFWKKLSSVEMPLRWHKFRVLLSVSTWSPNRLFLRITFCRFPLIWTSEQIIKHLKGFPFLSNGFL